MIISLARRLRHSNVSIIHNDVFINANLTKAEATAAYELRCARRLTAARRAPSGDSTASYTPPPGVAVVLLGIAVALSLLQHVTRNTLSSFVPAAGSQITVNKQQQQQQRRIADKVVLYVRILIIIL